MRTFSVGELFGGVILSGLLVVCWTTMALDAVLSFPKKKQKDCKVWDLNSSRLLRHQAQAKKP